MKKNPNTMNKSSKVNRIKNNISNSDLVHSNSIEKKQKLVAVIGMHRSGTSAITRGLKALGFYLGDAVLPAQQDNIKGFWEDSDINAFNIKILNAIDKDWDSLSIIQPKDIDLLREQGYFLKAVELLRQKINHHSLFCFKDPRVAKLLPFWHQIIQHLNIDFSYVISVRHPMSVARSLKERNIFTNEKTYYLWLEHIVPVFTDTTNVNKIVVDFDLLMADPKAQLQRIARILDLSFDENSADIKEYINEFLDMELRHSQFNIKDLQFDPSVPVDVIKAYEIILRLAQDEISIDTPEVAQAFTQFDVNLRSLSPAFSYITSLEREANKRDKQIADYQQKVIEQDAQIGAYHNTVLGRDEQIASYQQRVIEQDVQIAAYHRTVLERDEQIAGYQQKAIKQDAQIAAYHHTVLERDEQIAGYQQKAIEQDATLLERDQQIASYQHSLIEREEIIRQLYASHSWKITRPLRVLSRLIKEIIPLIPKLTPSNIAKLVLLIKPHLYAIYKQPNLIPKKLYFLAHTWRQTGIIGVVAKLHESKPQISEQPVEIVTFSISDLMQYIAKSIHQVHTGKTKKLPTHKVTVVIPVYRGADETARCINSVLASNNSVAYELVIINDASPESEMDSLLQSLEGKYPHVSILKNDKNLGFVGTVNRGMSLHDDMDVLLLNSDTIVANNWLDKLVAQAYADEQIATVTPFSNNATICNYPDLDGWAILPKNETIAQLDQACLMANAGMAIDIPTAVGFCMYIKRDCLKQVGLFDEKAFGKGYGEENDFCVRASNQGWKHILATDTFVFHEGEVSFSSTAALKKAQAMKILRKRYPDYENTVFSHIIQNAAYPYRTAVTAARYRLDQRSVVLFITHALGGGTEKHVQELAEAVSQNNALVLFLRPARGENGCDVTLEAYHHYDKLKLDLSSQNIELLANVLKAFGVNKVHIHHTLGFVFPVELLVTLMAVPYDVTIHDFYSICPRINLMRPKQGYCGSPTVNDCNACLVSEPKVIDENMEIIWWRAKYASLLNGANNVYCPSHDTATRISRYYPAASVKVVPHELISISAIRPFDHAKPYQRFAILGVLTEHKGLNLINSALAIIEQNNLPIEFVLIGNTMEQDYPIPSTKNFTQTGSYEDAELPALIEEVNPDAILFLSQCPETYSYTLTAALLSGRSVIAPNIGAFPERVQDMPNVFIFPYNYSGLELANFLMSLNMNDAITKGY